MYVHLLSLYRILLRGFLISIIWYSFAVDKVVIKESYYYYYYYKTCIHFLAPAGDRTRDLLIPSRTLWPLLHRPQSFETWIQPYRLPANAMWSRAVDPVYWSFEVLRQADWWVSVLVCLAERATDLLTVHSLWGGRACIRRALCGCVSNSNFSCLYRERHLVQMAGRTLWPSSTGGVSEFVLGFCYGLRVQYHLHQSSPEFTPVMDELQTISDLFYTMWVSISPTSLSTRYGSCRRWT